MLADGVDQRFLAIAERPVHDRELVLLLAGEVANQLRLLLRSRHVDLRFGGVVGLARLLEQALV